MCIKNLVESINWIVSYIRELSMSSHRRQRAKYTCQITTCEQTYQVNNEKIKYHNTIRYVYFPSSQFLENYVFNQTGKVLIKITRLATDTSYDCEFDLDQQLIHENVIDGKRVQEICLSYPDFSVILRCSVKTKQIINLDKGYIIFRFNRDNIELY